MARIVRFFLYRVSRAFCVQHSEPYGTALTPGGRCLRAPRQRGIASNRCHTKVYAMRLLEVIPSHCSAASTRTPPAQGSRRTFSSENQARLKRKERFAQWHESFLYLFIAFRGLFAYSIANRPELPSRRAGGGFGHTVRGVLPQIDAMPKFVQYGCLSMWSGAVKTLDGNFCSSSDSGRSRHSWSGWRVWWSK